MWISFSGFLLVAPSDTCRAYEATNQTYVEAERINCRISNFSEKSSKKVLTKSVKRSILTELSARGTKQAADR